METPEPLNVNSSRSRWVSAGALLLASFTSLYFELLLIRWVPTTLHVVGFFNNLVLIASFLGLGIGMAGARSAKNPVWQAFVRLAVLCVIMILFLRLDIAVLMPESAGINEFEYAGQIYKLPLFAILLGVFGLVVWANLPLGQLVGGYFDQLPRIPGYSVNIAGSLLGVLAFTAAAWLELPPLAWFLVGLGVLWCLDRRVVHALPACLILAALLVQQFLMRPTPDTKLLWSPYYKVVVTPVLTHDLNDGFSVQVNDQFLLTGLRMDSSVPLPEPFDNDPDTRESKKDAIRNEQVYHEFPFRLRSEPKRVLVLGAGVGNDVALALRHKAEKVVAVEIDPVVIKLGQFHPEKPYSDKRVQVIYNDARAYLNNTDEKFDLILFATLDAHGLLSSVGNLRLDSFVYTQESLTAAKRHLADNGLLILSFGPFRPETQYRQYYTLRNVFGEAPRFFTYGNVNPKLKALGNQTLVAGDVRNLELQQLPPQWREVPLEEVDRKLAEYPSSVYPATDDWPHLYIKERRIPTEYLFVLAGILIVSAAMVFYHFRSDGFRPDGHFFFLGAAFLLMETKGITELSLLLGSTWQVNSVVFVVILIVILLANLLILRLGRPIFVPVAFALLGLTLASEYAWPVSSWGLNLGSGAPALGALYLGVPIFFAAVIFASTFSHAKLASAALASNLLGSVFGGVTEYLSLAYGIRFLSLLALAMYAGAFLFWLRQQRSRAAEAPAIIKDDPTTALAAQPGV